MKMRCKYFRGSLKSWPELFGQAADFATEIGVDHVISISHACAGSDGTVAVWYWVSGEE
jgi:hypothetical protein